MIILLDENIPEAEVYFSRFVEKNGGELRFKAGREIAAADVRDVDALIVRSVSKVDKSLLEFSPVKFVGSCTIGMDHIDTAYLDQRGIVYSNAAACNANSVVEYVFAALAHLNCDWQGKRLGIIGMGNVGSALYKRAAKLGIECVGYDPLIEQDRYPVLTSLEEVLAADIVSMHAPLTRTGPYPSYKMIGQAEILRLKAGAVLLNCGRGDCLDNRALLERINNKGDLLTVLDVWQDEPNLHADVLAAVDIATPHIAGYSYDGKVTGTRMIAERLSEFLSLDWINPRGSRQDPESLSNLAADSAFELLRQLIPHCYDISQDDKNLREAMHLQADDVAKAFDALRKNYPKRREFFHYRLAEVDGLTEKEKQRLEQSLAALGFSQ
ncbi:4-phosphoerythronate dehydrogenase [uncultured Pseudoteredinibacter sp.]|uniref:4-phosphoerythronate dehydrogenase n=1 Tax=uncultured Pseudoteredinibacter sp. TaxID=1641701 RepID=UPI00261B3FB9|nr:4-phosphoerythronate dehydrogenase [uncultured Pseudoteredinibacter sp.]